MIGLGKHSKDFYFFYAKLCFVAGVYVLYQGFRHKGNNCAISQLYLHINCTGMRVVLHISLFP